jgi:hypothetical protein
MKPVEQKVDMEEQKVAFLEQKVASEVQKVPFLVQKVASEVQKVPQSSHCCSNCYKEFTSMKSLRRHADICKHIQNPLECERCHKILSSKSTKSRHMQICTGRSSNLVTMDSKPTTNPPPVNTLFQNIGTIQNQWNQTIININTFGQENKAHLTPDFLDSCLRNITGKGVCDLIEKVHFNPDLPENHNVRLESTKRNMLRVKEEDRWRICDKTEVIDKLIETGCRDLHVHYLESKIKEEDEIEHFRVICHSLMAIYHKNPGIYHPICRNIFAKILNLETIYKA